MTGTDAPPRERPARVPACESAACGGRRTLRAGEWARASLDEGGRHAWQRAAERLTAWSGHKSTDGDMTDDTTHDELPRDEAPRLDETMSFESVGAGVEPPPGDAEAVMRPDRWNVSSAHRDVAAAVSETGDEPHHTRIADLDAAAPWRDDEAYVPRVRSRRMEARGGGFTSGRAAWFQRLPLSGKLGIAIPAAVLA